MTFEQVVCKILRHEAWRKEAKHPQFLEKRYVTEQIHRITPSDCHNNINSSDFESSIDYALTRHPATPNLITFSQPEHANIEIYTDGSKADSKVGSGFIAFHNSNEIASGRYRLGKHCSVLQAELFAIKMAVTWSVTNYTNNTVAIISDSASSISLLQSATGHPISNEIKDIINNTNNCYFIYWTRAHQGTPGNERADALAKSAGDDTNLPISYTKLTSKTVKNLLWKDLIISWQQDWNDINHHTTYNFIPLIEPFILSRWYKPCHRASQFLSNHGRFNSYLTRFTNASNPNCSLCGVEDGSRHYFFDCPMLEPERLCLKLTIEAHGGIWPTDCTRIFDYEDTYDAFLTLITKYFVRTTVNAYS
ncbi:uncharacterized protein LOC111619360 [Centruroides sculpturatus]|uniref:uncharacterized protein LOC111619360 n=1 Tax=Centruroides sculpturatus TaxID=218467 RepID=UPI000C6E88A3|nr:uncharacterized protein LOC111619360 [Centruroides sculpturatus]